MANKALPLRQVADQFADLFQEILHSLDIHVIASFWSNTIHRFQDGQCAAKGLEGYTIGTDLYEPPIPKWPRDLRRSLYTHLAKMSAYTMVTYVDILSCLEYRLRLRFSGDSHTRDVEVDLGTYLWREAPAPLWYLYVISNSSMALNHREEWVATHFWYQWRWEVTGAELASPGLYFATAIKHDSDDPAPTFHLLFLEGLTHEQLGRSDNVHLPVQAVPVLVWGLPYTGKSSDEAATNSTGEPAVNFMFPLASGSKLNAKLDAFNLPSVRAFLQAVSVSDIIKRS